MMDDIIVVDRQGPLEKFLRYPEDHRAYLTGSRAFDVACEDSDYDYFINVDDWAELGFSCYRTTPRDYDLVVPNEFECVHFLYRDKKFDILVMNSYWKAAWLFATRCFLDLVDRNARFRVLIKDKCIRINIFEKLKTEYYEWGRKEI
jgi:hypothetical protein